MNALVARLWIALIGATSAWSQASRTRLGNVLGDLLCSQRPDDELVDAWQRLGPVARRMIVRRVL